MLRYLFVEFLLMAEDAPAPAPAPGAVPKAPGGLFDGIGGLLVPMAAVFAIFWLLVFRPESRKRKEREQMISNVKKGDTVVTQGGLLGKVWRVDGNEVVVVIDKDKEVKARFMKSGIAGVLPEDMLSGKKAGEAGGREAEEAAKS
jgi:preprotein translocase subunit YajC